MTAADAAASGPAPLSPAATLACAVACGAMVANLFYAQPLVELIAGDLGIGGRLAGLVVTLTQLGYGAGLLLVVPLADRIENRGLIVGAIVMTAAALAGVALAQGSKTFLAATLLLGFCSSGAQVIVPFAASLAPEATRGRTIGSVMAGLLAGIMLARPAASLVAQAMGWRALFWIAAGTMLALAFWLYRALPPRQPKGEPYGLILASLGRIWMSEPTLRRRAVYQGMVFAIFNIFWTAAPLMLARGFGFGQRGIALFALTGAAGALSAPIAGRLGDRGHVRIGTAAALATITISLLLAGRAADLHSLPLLVLFAITLDGATQVNQVLGQRVIYALPGEERGRRNAIYMTIVFLLGAGGSAVATLAFGIGGWWGAVTIGTALGLLVIAIFATEPRPRRGVAVPAPSDAR
ncbi:MAG: major facilitator superfamily 1 [Sphingomonas bacterium]|uniref:MFS transporter n=1 Tax=Sphingomonas bacterium TaxID=1895847 RepID=UPI00261D09A7|nr:MFS transporter [Sphingomonas bacterium]MDB5708498.1 major facilitator superfamily 1 [Sphingomonas bacterium]